MVKPKDQIIKSQSNIFDINADELYQLYIEKNLTCQQCAEHFGCSKLTITLLVEKYDYHKSQCQKALSAKPSIKIDKNNLYQQYIIENKTIAELAKFYHCSTTTVTNNLKINKISKKRANILDE